MSTCEEKTFFWSDFLCCPTAVRQLRPKIKEGNSLFLQPSNESHEYDVNLPRSTRNDGPCLLSVVSRCWNENHIFEAAETVAHCYIVSHLHKPKCDTGKYTNSEIKYRYSSKYSAWKQALLDRAGWEARSSLPAKSLLWLLPISPRCFGGSIKRICCPNIADLKTNFKPRWNCSAPLCHWELSTF